jgi:hypothetical protein
MRRVCPCQASPRTQEAADIRINSLIVVSRLINKEKYSSKDRANNSRRKDYEKCPHNG